MARQGESALVAGDVVLLQGTPDIDINGKEATLVRRAGTEKWIVSVVGKEKSQIVQIQYMRKLRKDESQIQICSIVGSWDDWDAHPMLWDDAKRCYEFDVEMGADGSESFKMLIADDWDRCVYPSHSHASPFDNHTICGPDAGGLDECWTIGEHQEDKAAPGDIFKVRLFLLPDGKPQLVKWTRNKVAPTAVPRVAVKQVLVQGEPRQNVSGAPEVRGTSVARPPASQAKLAPTVVDLPEDVDVAQVRRSSSQPRQIHFTGNKNVDTMHKRVDDALAMQAASVAAERARQTDDEGCFEVLHPRLAVRAGPSTSALNLAVAKLGKVIRGTPHTVDGHLWLMLDALALRRLGATAYDDPGEQATRGWALMDGNHLGLGLLLRKTSKAESPDEYKPFTREQAVEAWKMKSYVKPREEVSREDPFGLASLDRAESKAEVKAGKTNCMVCGFRALTSREKIAHDRSTGHDGFWMCPT